MTARRPFSMRVSVSAIAVALVAVPLISFAQGTPQPTPATPAPAPTPPAAAPAAEPASGVLSRDAALEVRRQFVNDLDTLQSRFLALADAFPASKYSWRPAKGVRSVGEVFMHVASEYYVFAPMAYGAQPSPLIPMKREEFKKFESKATKPEVKKQLNEGFAYTKQTLEALDPTTLGDRKKLFGTDRTIVATSLIMSGDLHEHLGQLIAYARTNGIKPPWTK